MPDRQPSPRGVSGQAMAEETPEVVLRAYPGGTASGGPAPAGPGNRPGGTTRPPGQRSRGRDPAAPSWGRRRVLLLNATFEPLTALPLRRAVVLVMCGKAEVVHGDPGGIELHAATLSLPVPSVIRLSTYVRVPYRAKVPLTRAGLMHRDRYRCAYCGGGPRRSTTSSRAAVADPTAGRTASPAAPSATTAKRTGCSRRSAGSCASSRGPRTARTGACSRTPRRPTRSGGLTWVRPPNRALTCAGAPAALRRPGRAGCLRGASRKASALVKGLRRRARTRSGR